jgi:hypothetical protein
MLPNSDNDSLDNEKNNADDDSKNPMKYRDLITQSHSSYLSFVARLLYKANDFKNINILFTIYCNACIA